MQIAGLGLKAEAHHQKKLRTLWIGHVASSLSWNLDVVVGNRIGILEQLFKNMQKVVVVWFSDLVGLWMCSTFHEDPFVPHYGKAGRGLRLREGMVLTVEPMISTGTWEIDTDMETGWMHKTLDGGLSCQYEHQLVITKDGPIGCFKEKKKFTNKFFYLLRRKMKGGEDQMKALFSPACRLYKLLRTL